MLAVTNSAGYTPACARVGRAVPCTEATFSPCLMDRRVSELENIVDELCEEVRFLRSEVARLRRLLEGSSSTPTRGTGPLSSSRGGHLERSPDRQDGGRDPAGPESASEAESFQLLSEGPRSERSFNQDASRSRSGYSTPGARSSSAGSGCSLSWEEREAICEEIAGWVVRCLRSHHRGASGRDRINLSSRVWLVFRSFEGEVYDPVEVCRTFAACKRLVKRGEEVGDSVFVGLPSDRETRRVVSFAGASWPQ